ncbi:hypothetical protein G2W53_042649 [Senna tora]|uniref:Uncharacterized protein n=1 Tax=Senna tora TaxID=362788 RepID=A0A834VZ54_9FABA|nr:hypothetical protein G2W53_042649 [Senna tora]
MPTFPRHIKILVMIWFQKKNSQTHTPKSLINQSSSGALWPPEAALSLSSQKSSHEPHGSQCYSAAVPEPPPEPPCPKTPDAAPSDSSLSPSQHHILYGLFICFLSCDCEIPSFHCLLVLQLHPCSQTLEIIHQVLQLLPQPAHHRRAGPVRRGARPAARDVPLGCIGLLQGLKLALDDFHALQDLLHVLVHSGSKVLHGLRIVHDLALLIGLLQFPVQFFDMPHVFLDILDVLEEFVEVDGLLPHLHIVQVCLLLQVSVLPEGA